MCICKNHFSGKMKFGQLILKKIIKTVATRCQILRLKCTLQRSPRTPSWIKGDLLLRKGEGKGKKKGKRGRERQLGEEKGENERKRRGPPCVSLNILRIAYRCCNRYDVITLP